MIESGQFMDGQPSCARLCTSPEISPESNSVHAVSTDETVSKGSPHPTPTPKNVKRLHTHIKYHVLIQSILKVILQQKSHPYALTQQQISPIFSGPHGSDAPRRLVLCCSGGCLCHWSPSQHTGFEPGWPRNRY